MPWTGRAPPRQHPLPHVFQPQLFQVAAVDDPPPGISPATHAAWAAWRPYFPRAEITQQQVAVSFYTIDSPTLPQTGKSPWWEGFRRRAPHAPPPPFNPQLFQAVVVDSPALEAFRPWTGLRPYLMPAQRAPLFPFLNAGESPPLQPFLSWPGLRAIPAPQQAAFPAVLFGALGDAVPAPMLGLAPGWSGFRPYAMPFQPPAFQLALMGLAGDTPPPALFPPWTGRRGYPAAQQAAFSAALFNALGDPLPPPMLGLQQAARPAFFLAQRMPDGPVFAVVVAADSPPIAGPYDAWWPTFRPWVGPRPQGAALHPGLFPPPDSPPIPLIRGQMEWWAGFRIPFAGRIQGAQLPYALFPPVVVEEPQFGILPAVHAFWSAYRPPRAMPQGGGARLPAILLIPPVLDPCSCEALTARISTLEALVAALLSGGSGGTTGGALVQTASSSDLDKLRRLVARIRQEGERRGWKI